MAQNFAMRGALGAITALACWAIFAAAPAGAAFISSAGDPALSGAVTFDFNSEPLDTYFTTRNFGGAFTLTPDVDELHMDDEWCAQFGTTGNCIDTLSQNNGANDDFRIDFDLEVWAFGFALNALDADWTLETYDSSDNLLGSYSITSQSPALTGFNRRGYAGATETTPIAYATIQSVLDDRALIDDFAYVVVASPEPSTGILATLGLLALLIARRSGIISDVGA